MTSYEGRANIHPTVWLTGLSGAGKSTIANALYTSLQGRGQKAIVLDGDTLREGMCSDLGYSPEDRAENLRRIAHISRLFSREGYVVIVATISPLRSHRELARSIVGDGYLEVFVYAPLEVCIARDPKGLYSLAKKGCLSQFTGISAVYETPCTPDVSIDTTRVDVESAMSRIVESLNSRTGHSGIGPAI